MDIYDNRIERGTESCSKISSKEETCIEPRLFGLSLWPLSQDNSHFSRGS